MSAPAEDQPVPQYNDEDARNFIDCWCPIPVRAYIARLAAGDAANTAIAPDLFERIEHAISRITRGEGAMRVPADSTDPDLVLAECRDVLSALTRKQAARQEEGAVGGFAFDALVVDACKAAYSACDMGPFPEQAVDAESDKRFVAAALRSVIATPPGSGEAGAGYRTIDEVRAMRTPEQQAAVDEARADLRAWVDENRATPPVVTEAGVSRTTAQLIDLLRQRDATGLAKYGTTLDRTDLTPAQWIQHAIEELLDGAGYLKRLQRDLEASR